MLAPIWENSFDSGQIRHITKFSRRTWMRPNQRLTEHTWMRLEKSVTWRICPLSKVRQNTTLKTDFFHIFFNFMKKYKIFFRKNDIFFTLFPEHLQSIFATFCSFSEKTWSKINENRTKSTTPSKSGILRGHLNGLKGSMR